MASPSTEDKYFRIWCQIKAVGVHSSVILVRRYECNAISVSNAKYIFLAVVFRNDKTEPIAIGDMCTGDAKTRGLLRVLFVKRERPGEAV